MASYDEPLDLTKGHQDPPSSPLDLSVRKASEISRLATPSGRDHKRKIVTSTSSSSSKRAKMSDLEILERYYWRDRVFPRDNLIQPFYYVVRCSVKGERALISHGKLLDYCTKETLDFFNRRFCKNCGLESGTNPEFGPHNLSCPAQYRFTPRIEQGAESYITKLLERHYWPNCADREGEESSFFKVEWSYPGLPEYVPSSWIQTKEQDEKKPDLLFYFKNKNRL